MISITFSLRLITSILKSVKDLIMIFILHAGIRLCLVGTTIFIYSRKSQKANTANNYRDRKKGCVLQNLRVKNIISLSLFSCNYVSKPYAHVLKTFWEFKTLDLLTEWFGEMYHLHYMSAECFHFTIVVESRTC